jgi:hypothetical protein
VILHGTHQQTIEGSHTALRSPIVIAKAPSGNLIVVNPRKVTEPHRPGTIVTLNPKLGNTHARHVIACETFAPWGVAVDASSNIWMTDNQDNAIREYAPGSNRCAQPLVSIQGGATQLDGPLGIASTSKGDILPETSATTASWFSRPAPTATRRQSRESPAPTPASPTPRGSRST